MEAIRSCSKSKLKHQWMQIHHAYSCVRLRTLSHHTVRIPAHPWLKSHSSEQWRPRASLSVYLQMNVMAFGSWTWSSGAYLSKWTWPTGSLGVCQSLPVTRHTCITHAGARLPVPRRLFPILAFVPPPHFLLPPIFLLLPLPLSPSPISLLLSSPISLSAWWFPWPSSLVTRPKAAPK